jgi:hypothetical protein
MNHTLGWQEAAKEAATSMGWKLMIRLSESEKVKSGEGDHREGESGRGWGGVNFEEDGEEPCEQPRLSFGWFMRFRASTSARLCGVTNDQYTGSDE